MTEQKYNNPNETMKKGLPPDPEVMKRFEQNRTKAVEAFRNPDLSYEQAMAIATDLLGKAAAEDLYQGLARKN